LTPINPIIGNMIISNPRIIASKLINLVFIFASYYLFDILIILI